MSGALIKCNLSNLKARSLSNKSLLLDGFDELGSVQVQPLKSQEEDHVKRSLLLDGFDERSTDQVQPLKSQDEKPVLQISVVRWV